MKIFSGISWLQVGVHADRDGDDLSEVLFLLGAAPVVISA